MKQRKCPYKGNLCYDYGYCEDCEWSNLIYKYESKIARITKKYENLLKRQQINFDNVKNAYVKETAKEIEKIIRRRADHEEYFDSNDLYDLADFIRQNYGVEVEE